MMFYRCDVCLRESQTIPTVPITIGVPTSEAIGNFTSIDLCEICWPKNISRTKIKEFLIAAINSQNQELVQSDSLGEADEAQT